MRNKAEMNNNTKPNCYWYTHGGNISKGFPSYPSEYGARCQKYDKFFSIENNRLEPNCSECNEE